MTKGLEALERLYCAGNLQLDYVLSNKHKQDYEIVEKALQRLEAIDNANSSEALEMLNAIYLQFYFDRKDKMTCDGLEESVNTIKQALIKAKEQEKVLSIIKEKEVDVDFLNHVFKYNQKLKEYNFFAAGKYRKLTEEEFDLLKRWL